MPVNVYVVEDHAVMRATIRMLLDREEDFDVCGMAASGEAAMADLPCDAPQLVIVDMSLPDMSGADLVRRLGEVWPEVPCMILSGHGEQGYVRMALEAGAQGYVLKGEPGDIPRAMRAVVGGERYLSPSLDVPDEGR